MSNDGNKDKKRGWKVFNDSVHGHMHLHPLCVKIIDTLEFQRLRNIKQVGTTYLVYPGASHNRFEHSLGVCYLAGEMIDALKQNDATLEISSTDKLCVQIAGLCHDLGHGPFSHLWEEFLQLKGVDWHHENHSVDMFYYLIKKNHLTEEFEKYDLDEDKRKFITELILGEGNSCEKNKQFLFQIVNNKINTIDVDKWDYFLRDGLHLNLKISFDYRRLLKFCKVIEREENDGKKKKHIAFRSKESYNIYEMFLLRSSLHFRAYQHRVSLVTNRMILDALLAADEFYSIKIDGNVEVKLSEAHKYPNIWSRLTDHIFYAILWNSSDDLLAAQGILNSVLCRHLYKYVTSRRVVPSEEVKRNPKWVLDVTQSLEQHLNRRFKDVNNGNEFAVVYCSIQIGSGITDPFKYIYFYDKNNPEVAEEKDCSVIDLYPIAKQPAHHVELYIFCKNRDAHKVILEEAKGLTDSFIESFTSGTL